MSDALPFPTRPLRLQMPRLVVIVIMFLVNIAIGIPATMRIEVARPTENQTMAGNPKDIDATKPPLQVLANETDKSGVSTRASMHGVGRAVLTWTDQITWLCMAAVHNAAAVGSAYAACPSRSPCSTAMHGVSRALMSAHRVTWLCTHGWLMMLVEQIAAANASAEQVSDSKRLHRPTNNGRVNQRCPACMPAVRVQ